MRIIICALFFISYTLCFCTRNFGPFFTSQKNHDDHDDRLIFLPLLTTRLHLQQHISHHSQRGCQSLLAP